MPGLQAPHKPSSASQRPAGHRRLRSSRLLSDSPHLLNSRTFPISIVSLQRVFSLTTNDRRLKTDDRSLTFTDMVESNCRVARTSHYLLTYLAVRIDVTGVMHVCR